ncbi:MAG: glycoside hydrolase family 95 protein [Terriglobia bacterium]|jgi:alpha-L-fucosidase 2
MHKQILSMGFVLTLAASALGVETYSRAPLSLWYRQPASAWVEALPLGNGRLGAMVFGGTRRERIQFNEGTVWRGRPHSYAHVGAVQYLGALRKLLFEGKQAEAEALAMREFMSVPLTQSEYQALGDLLLEFPDVPEQGVSGYRRELNLESAVATTRFTVDGVEYRREALASWPAQAIVIRLSASRPGKLTFSATLQSAHAGASITGLPGGELSMAGGVAESAIRFGVRLRVLAQRGERKLERDRIVVSGADSAVLILMAATNFQSFRDVSGDPETRNDAAFAALTGQTWQSLRAAHVADYRKLFTRVRLDLGSTPSAAQPTDERIRDFATRSDPQLVALLFQYGRYLLIASSRRGGQPATLQGLWNDSNHPPWGSKYTCNINTEMNYWPAEVTNLAECHLPLFAALEDLAISGADTAQEHYGARGWVLHHNFDLWRGTAPINASNHGIWQTGGAWLSQHLWEHYLFGGDQEFLRATAYPIMKGSALFFLDALVEDPRRGWLISGPSCSPEQGGLVMGPTMDHQIVRGLFGAVIAASRILDVDADLRQQLMDERGRIAPNQIGRYGQLQEWLEDKDDPKNTHRHVSHLWGLYPGGEITPSGTPDLFAAAKKSLEFRGDAATGWSMGWKVNLWARLLDGDHSWRILQLLIHPAREGTGDHAGLYPNLFDAHPPFQIDGNFGATAGIAEMLLQSNDPAATPLSLTPAQTGEAAVVRLLPALPSALPDGKVTGLRARGGLEVDLTWRGGKLLRATLRASAARPVRVLYAGRQVDLEAAAGGVYQFDGELRRRPGSPKPGPHSGQGR